MEEKTKSNIIGLISKSVNDRKDFKGEYRLKKTTLSVKISIEFKEQETFTDANGIKWVRA